MPVAPVTPLLTPVGFSHLAEDQVGKPYILGAEASPKDPDPPAFDCSELVEWLYARAGNRITDLAAAQFDATEPVKGSPQVGDLVFLANNPARWNSIGHVAILTRRLPNGGWRVIEARGRRYGVVQSTLSYWQDRAYYAGLRRLPSFTLKPGKAPEVALPAGPKGNLKRGSRGERVAILQRRMNRLGYQIEVTGDYDRKTESAVIDFQRKAGFKGRDVDGVVGPKTSAKTVAAVDRVLAERAARR